MDLLVRRYKDDPENAIENAVGKTDAFFFSDKESHEIIKLWSEGNEKEAYKKLKKYVSGITTETSGDS